jgi:hypothetical protein
MLRRVMMRTTAGMPLAIMPDRSKRPVLRRALGALWVLLVSSVVAMLALLAIDVYMHRRTQDLAGVNVWGYRGAPAGAKQSGDVRIVMLGGSTAFGYGLPSHESIPAFLERRLNAAAGAAGRRFTVINLGAPGQGAHGFKFDLADYAYLDYEVALLYEGYNDLGSDGVPADVPQRASPNYAISMRPTKRRKWRSSRTSPRVPPQARCRPRQPSVRHSNIGWARCRTSRWRRQPIRHVATAGDNTAARCVTRLNSRWRGGRASR